MVNLIHTTGELRVFLAELLTKVRDGEIDVAKATAMTRAAQQINECFYAEIKIARVQAEIGGTIVPMGELPLGGRIKKPNAK